MKGSAFLQLRRCSPECVKLPACLISTTIFDLASCEARAVILFLCVHNDPKRSNPQRVVVVDEEKV